MRGAGLCCYMFPHQWPVIKMSPWWVFFFYQIPSLDTFCQSQASSFLGPPWPCCSPAFLSFLTAPQDPHACSSWELQAHPTPLLFASLLKLASSPGWAVSICCKDSRPSLEMLPITQLRKAGRGAWGRAAQACTGLTDHKIYIYIYI